MPGYCSGAAETDGPPSTMALPWACARRARSSIWGRWMCMPEVNTKSAQARSPSVAGPAFSSTKRTCQAGGR